MSTKTQGIFKSTSQDVGKATGSRRGYNLPPHSRLKPRIDSPAVQNCTVADPAEVVSGRVVSPGDYDALHHRQDRYVRFFQLDPQNRNIFTSQRKGSFDTKKDALVLA